jgi:hypothetical protein
MRISISKSIMKTMSTFTLNQAQALYEDFLNLPLPVPIPAGMCTEEDCEGTMVDQHDFPYCDTCGAMDTDNPTYTDLEVYIPKPILYKRRQYCVEKLHLMTGMKQSRSPKYKQMLKTLKSYDFDDLQELRDAMKEAGFHKQYKHLYNIYFDLKRVRLIQLTGMQIDLLSREFVELEWKFKTSSTLKRRNMLSYATIIWFVMRAQKIPGSEHILLPLNHEDLVIVLESL